MPAIIWWTRRDLRLHDNEALQAALTHDLPVVPVFVLDPALLAAPDVGEKRLTFLSDGLRSLDADLRRRGSRLIIRRGAPEAELKKLVVEAGAVAIYAEGDPWPYAQARDASIAAALPLHLTGGMTLWPYDAVVKENGSPFSVFTPYSRAWKALPLPTSALLKPPPDRFAPVPPLSSLSLPEWPAMAGESAFPAGEVEALRRLSAFTSGNDAPVRRYAVGRNQLAHDGTSRLSPYLRFGMLSVARAAVAAVHVMKAAGDAKKHESAETWLNELIWRDFYQSVLYHHPHVLEQEFQAGLRGIRWRADPDGYLAWGGARTGYPVVDAAMRQLFQTGWMHNRARMIAASFLVKDLLIDWRLGERFFMQHLLDADPAANNGGWQWTAGVGTDAAPYFRIFNPTLQSAKFDPHGAYIRRWLPELARVPDKYIHEPARMPLALQQEAGCIIGRDYPAPIVDHALARERALRAYRNQ